MRSQAKCPKKTKLTHCLSDIFHLKYCTVCSQIFGLEQSSYWRYLIQLYPTSYLPLGLMCNQNYRPPPQVLSWKFNFWNSFEISNSLTYCFTSSCRFAAIIMQRFSASVSLCKDWGSIWNSKAVLAGLSFPVIICAETSSRPFYAFPTWQFKKH